MTPLRRRRILALCLRVAPLLGLLAVATACAPEDPITVPERMERVLVPRLSEQIANWQSWPRVEAGYPEDLEAGRHNWENFADASFVAGVELFGDMFRMVALVKDDKPLLQPYERLRHPDWWGIPVAGDALEIRLRPLDLTRDPFEATIQFGAEGLAPELIVTRSPRGPAGPVAGAIVQVQRVSGGYEVFVQLVETNRWGLVPFYTSGYEITVSQHDLDGEPASYTRLTGRTTTRP